MIFNFILFILGVYCLARWFGIFGIFIIISVLSLVFGLASNNPEIGLIGILLCFICFLGLCAIPYGSSKKQHYENLKKDTKKQDEYIEEWGTIDYKEK